MNRKTYIVSTLWRVSTLRRVATAHHALTWWRTWRWLVSTAGTTVIIILCRHVSLCVQLQSLARERSTALWHAAHSFRERSCRRCPCRAKLHVIQSASCSAREVDDCSGSARSAGGRVPWLGWWRDGALDKIPVVSACFVVQVWQSNSLADRTYFHC